MTEPTQMGSIVAYLTLRREDWTSGVRATEQDARRLGTLNPRIRIDANTNEILAQLGLVHAAERKIGTEAGAAKPFVVNLWAALAAVAPAAVPITAVAGGALLGLLPTIAAVALGVSGIKDEMKSGALEGTQYGDDLKQAGRWLDQLKATAASGILDGVDKAIQQSRGLFGALNSDIGQTSTQIGDVVAGAAPALLSILHQLEPLFSTIGADLADGAAGLEHWAQSSTGISKFVAYVQAELPEVEHLLGGVITLVSHLFEGAAGPGAALLHDLNLLVAALDSIPVGVIKTAIPLAISLYAAIKTGQGIGAIVTGINNAITKTGNALALTGPRAEAAAAAQTAASLQVQAAAAAEAAEVAATRATEAEAYAAVAAEATASSVAQAEANAAAAASAAAWGAAFDETAAVVAAAAQAEAAAVAASAAEMVATLQAEAAAAGIAATEISAAAEAAAATSTEAGAAASAGWASMLGPIGAVVVGVGLLSTLLIGSSDDTQRATEAQNSYADSVRKSTDALSHANVEQTRENLAKSGVYATLQKLHDANQALGVSQTDLTAAVNGSDEAYQRVTKALTGAGGAGDEFSHLLDKNGLAANAAKNDLDKYRKGLMDQIEQQRLLTQAERAAQQQTDGGAAATRAQAAALGTTSTAYLDAQVAAEKNADSTRSNTLAMQLENNAVGLLNQALQRFAGQNLSVAEAQTSFGQSMHGVLKSLHDNGNGFKGNSEKALANQQAIEGNVSAARQLAQAVAQQTHSNGKAIASYQESKRELEAQLAAQGKLTPALKRYIDRLYDVKGISDYLSKHPTKTDVDNGPASAKIDRLEARIKAIRQGRVPNIDADTAEGKRKLADLQAQIDHLQGKDIAVNLSVSGRGLKNLHGQVTFGFADGGTVPGAGDGDTVPAYLTPGEEVTPKRQAGKYRSLLKAIAADQVPGYAAGGTVYKVGSGYGFQGQYFSKKKDAQKAAADARHSAASQSTYDSMPGSDAWKSFLAAGASLQQTAANTAASAAEVRDAAKSLNAAAKAAGLSHKALAAIAADEKRLSADAAARESVRARLGTRPAAPTAYERLAAAQDQFRGDQQTYAGAASGFDITSVTGGGSTSRRVGAATITTAGTGLSADAIYASDAADVAQIKEFDALIHKLVAEGYDEDYVRQIAAKGPSAIETARALSKASPALVAKFNKLEKGRGSRTALAGDIGTFLAKSYDQAGVDSAAAFVHGLVSQEKQLTTEMQRIVARVEKKLKITVPVHAGGKRKKPKPGRRQGHDSGKRAVHHHTHVHAAPGQSESTIARLAASKILWHLDR